MAIVKYMAGKELTPEYLSARKTRIEAAAKRPYIYDPDCPLLTEKQLSEFRPVGGMSWEERSRLMKEAGITEKSPALI